MTLREIGKGFREAVESGSQAVAKAMMNPDQWLDLPIASVVAAIVIYLAILSSISLIAYGVVYGVLSWFRMKINELSNTPRLFFLKIFLSRFWLIFIVLIPIYIPLVYDSKLVTFFGVNEQFDTPVGLFLFLVCLTVAIFLASRLFSFRRRLGLDDNPSDET